MDIEKFPEPDSPLPTSSSPSFSQAFGRAPLNSFQQEAQDWGGLGAQKQRPSRRG